MTDIAIAETLHGFVAHSQVAGVSTEDFMGILQMRTGPEILAGVGLCFDYFPVKHHQLVTHFLSSPAALYTGDPHSDHEIDQFMIWVNALHHKIVGQDLDDEQAFLLRSTKMAILDSREVLLMTQDDLVPDLSACPRLLKTCKTRPDK